jgi:hypothetical protein
MKYLKLFNDSINSENTRKINDNYHSLSDYEGKWYENLLGLEFLHKYPQDFIDWINEDDTWAMNYTYKMKINKIIDLFDLWVNEKY